MSRSCAIVLGMRLGSSLGLMVWVSVAVGCGSASLDTGDGDYMDDDLPMGACPEPGSCSPGAGNSPGTVPVGGSCSDAGDCSEGAGCMAPWSDGEVGEFTCSATCIPNDDDSMWCLGSAACCDPEATCNARGLCRVGAVLEDTDGEEASGTTATDGDAGSSSGMGTTTTATGSTGD